MHAEGYAAGEMKHGPIALIEPGHDDGRSTTEGRVAEKTRANIEQVQAPAAASPSSRRLRRPSHWRSPRRSVDVPDDGPSGSPRSSTSSRCSSLAYHIAEMAHGCDIDKPRNLAKSVTVE